MTLQSFSEWPGKRPFRPFRLVMSGGQSYTVPRREMAFLTRSLLLVGVNEADDGVPSDVEMCPLDQVAAIEPLGDQTPYP